MRPAATRGPREASSTTEDAPRHPLTLADARIAMDAKAKPLGSLGLLESWSQQLMVLQQTFSPKILKGTAFVFAADHGVAREERVSMYDTEVTAQIFETMTAGGAACNVLAEVAGVGLQLYDVGIYCGPDRNRPGSYLGRIRPGTRNFCRGPALTHAEHGSAREVGQQAVRSALQAGGLARGTHVIMVGELGMGNTTVASTILAALTGCTAAEATGRGAGLNDEGLQRKIRVVESALEQHRGLIEAYRSLREASLENSKRRQKVIKQKDRATMDSPRNIEAATSEAASSEEAIGDDKNEEPRTEHGPQTTESGEAQTQACMEELVSAIGGLELAAMVGAFLEARAHGAPVLIDGFIASVAALVAIRFRPDCRDSFFLATRSPETGHSIAIAGMQRDLVDDDIPDHLAQPMLDIGLRLGEGTGAIMCYQLLKSAANIASDLWPLDRVLHLTGHTGAADSDVMPAFGTGTVTEGSARWVAR